MREQFGKTPEGGSVSRQSPGDIPSPQYPQPMRFQKVQALRFGAVVAGVAAIAVQCQLVFAQQQNSLPDQKIQEQAQDQFVTIVPIEVPAPVADPSAGSAPVATVPAVASPVSTSRVVSATPSSTEQQTPTAAGGLAASPKSSDYQMDEVRRQPIPFRKVIHLSSSQPLGTTRVAQSGANGILEKTYRVTYHGESPVKFELRGTRVAKQAVDMEVLAGYSNRSARALPSRSGNYTRSREFDMTATGYSPYEGSGSGRCANGMRAGFGLVAVDPRLIPLGTKLFVEGYGYALAADTGGAIHGYRIDLGQNTYHEAYNIGRRKVHVYVLNEER